MFFAYIVMDYMHFVASFSETYCVAHVQYVPEFVFICNKSFSVLSGKVSNIIIGECC